MDVVRQFSNWGDGTYSVPYGLETQQHFYGSGRAYGGQNDLLYVPYGQHKPPQGWTRVGTTPSGGIYKQPTQMQVPGMVEQLLQSIIHGR